MLLVCKAKFLYNVRLNKYRCSSEHHYQRVTETSLSTGYSWEGIRQVRATLLGAPCTRAPLWWLCLLGALYQVFDLLPFY